MQPLAESDWIEHDEQLAARIAVKRTLLARCRDDVFAAVDGSMPACREVLELLVRYLPARFPDAYRYDGTAVQTVADGVRQKSAALEHPLVVAGLLVDEDLLVLQPSADGYVLTAAFLCAPSHWRLGDKLGRSLSGVHEPVPGYATSIGKSVDRMFAQMKVERPLWRCNWGIATSPELFQPRRDADDLAHVATLAAEAVADSLFVRVERQTLRRLPVSGAILFTIKVYVDPVGCLAAYPQLAADLKTAITRLTEAERSYKALDVLGPPLMAYLDRILADAATVPADDAAAMRARGPSRQHGD